MIDINQLEGKTLNNFTINSLVSNSILLDGIDLESELNRQDLTDASLTLLI